MVGAMNLSNIASMGSSSMTPFQAGSLGSSLIGTLGSLGLGVFNAVNSSKQAEFEREMANKNFELARANYEKTWDWNYNKMQYARKDYEAAGFNPVLAAGAQQSTLTPSAPQYDTSGVRDARSHGYSSIKSMQDILFRNRIVQDMAEIRKTEADISRSDSEALLNAAKMRHTAAGARYYNALADKNIHDLNIYKDRGTPTNEPETVPFRAFNEFLDEYGLLGGALQVLGIGGVAGAAGKGFGALFNALKKPGNVQKLGNWLAKQGQKGKEAAEYLYNTVKKGLYNLKWW